MTRSRILIALAFIALLTVASLAMTAPLLADTAGGGGGGGTCQNYGSKTEVYPYPGCPSGKIVVGFVYTCCDGSCSWVQVGSWCYTY